MELSTINFLLGPVRKYLLVCSCSDTIECKYTNESRAKTRTSFTEKNGTRIWEPKVVFTHLHSTVPLDKLIVASHWLGHEHNNNWETGLFVECSNQNDNFNEKACNFDVLLKSQYYVDLHQLMHVWNSIVWLFDII